MAREPKPELIQRVEHSCGKLLVERTPDYFEKLANSVPRRLIQRILIKVVRPKYTIKKYKYRNDKWPLRSESARRSVNCRHIARCSPRLNAKALLTEHAQREISLKRARMLKTYIRAIVALWVIKLQATRHNNNISFYGIFVLHAYNRTLRKFSSRPIPAIHRTKYTLVCYRPTSLRDTTVRKQMSDQPANSASEVPRGSENVNPQEKHPCVQQHSHKWERHQCSYKWECHRRRPSDPRSRRLCGRRSIGQDSVLSADLGELSINFGGERYIWPSHCTKEVYRAAAVL
ncbi:unnamed protein product [Trichogramma brassicae]|uniref:Uncharacterized protein n=1 Tax=Trichogramma brassicae TaxID=86971 RepID=A0A6H5HRV8_9HYME|nr:unnamed protein product [Trichogramma brassicae]